MLLRYKILLLILIFITSSAYFFQGGRNFEVGKYEKQALIDKALIAELQTKSAKVDIQIVTEYVDKIKYVDRIKEVKTNVYVTKKDDIACVISPSTSHDIARMLNSASKGKIPEPPTGTDGSTK